MAGSVSGYRWLILTSSAKAWSSSTAFHVQSCFPRETIIRDVCWTGLNPSTIKKSRRSGSNSCRVSLKPLQSDHAAIMTGGTKGDGNVAREVILRRVQARVGVIHCFIL